jgi:hypothetical protein
MRFVSVASLRVKIGFVLCVGVGALEYTLHWGLWKGLLFWFRLFFCCSLSVGRVFFPHWHVGFYVGQCGCRCGGMLTLSFIEL